MSTVYLVKEHANNPHRPNTSASKNRPFTQFAAVPPNKSETLINNGYAITTQEHYSQVVNEHIQHEIFLKSATPEFVAAKKKKPLKNHSFAGDS